MATKGYLKVVIGALPQSRVSQRLARNGVPKSEQVGGCDGPAAGLAVDADVAELASAETVDHGVGEAETVGRCYLYLVDDLETEAEVPCHVKGLVLERVIDACAAGQEGERGAGGYEGRNDFADAGQPYHILEVDRYLDVVAV